MGYWIETPAGHEMHVTGSLITSIETRQALERLADAAFEQFAEGDSVRAQRQREDRVLRVRRLWCEWQRERQTGQGWRSLAWNTGYAYGRLGKLTARWRGRER